MLAVCAVIVIGLLLRAPGESGVVREGLFQVVSFATTTGFTTTDYSGWPLAATVLMTFAAFAGGCAGSTAGGLKMYRVMLNLPPRAARNPTAHPSQRRVSHQVRPTPSADRAADAVWGFFATYLILFLAMVFVMLVISDLDFLSAYSAVAANLNNLGPGLGDVAANYQKVPTAGKWVLMTAMVLGRLEIFTLLVLLSPHYWRS